MRFFTLKPGSEVKLSLEIVLVLVVVLEHPAFAPRRRLTLSQLFWAVGSFDQTARFPRTKNDDE